jgi:hypothetical protein
MKKSLNLSTLTFIVFLIACKKDARPSSQIISLLQNKWALSSETLTYPTNPSINASYTGTSTDYYLFNSNDTLLIQQAGIAGIPNSPISVAIRYSVIANNLIVLDSPTGAGNVKESIQKITTDTLILTNQITASFTNNGGSTYTIYNGTRTITLAK